MISKILAGLKQDKKRVGDDLPLIIVNDAFEMIKLTDVKEIEIFTAMKSGWERSDD